MSRFGRPCPHSGSRFRAFALVLVAGALCALAPSGYAKISITCEPPNNTINFGAYDVLGGAIVDGVGSFTVTCTGSGLPVGGQAVTYTASLAVSPARQLAPPQGTDRLSYNIYTESTRTNVWGDGTGGTFTFTGSVTVPNSGNGRGSVTTAPIPFYGRIAPGGQDVTAAAAGPPPTTYSQHLTITVTCVLNAPGAPVC